MARSALLFFTLHAFLLFSAPLVSAHGGSHDNDADSDSGSDSAGPPPNLRAKSLVLVKVYCLILVFAGTFAGGVSPCFLKWNEGFLVLGTQFSGGVFLGTAMMHFLSDSNETFEELTAVEYPFAFMLATAGYLITMIADCAIAHVVAGVGSAADVQVGQGGAGGSMGQVRSRNIGTQSQSPAKVENGTPNHSVKALYNASSLGDSLLLIVALCFHSVFEGIAIGVAENKAEAWRALWTISLHKIFAAIAMGIALLRMIPDRPLLSCTAYAFAFAISSPIGVAIGIVIDATTQGRVADWIYAISMGLACGVFIYVSINHLLSNGYKPLQKIAINSPLNRWMAVVFGVGVIAVVMIWD